MCIQLTTRGMKKIALWGICLLSQFTITHAQLCSGGGQTPPTAILVCGSATISVGRPGNCGQTNLPPPCGDGFPYRDLNPHFYRMNCFASGTLGFSILPEEPAD